MNCELLELMSLTERVPPPVLVTVKVAVPVDPLVTGVLKVGDVVENAGGI